MSNTQEPNNLFVELHKAVDNEVKHILPSLLEKYFYDLPTTETELRQLIREEVKDIQARENEVKSKKSSAPLISPGTITLGFKGVNTSFLATPLNIFSGPSPLNVVMVPPERVKCARSGCQEKTAKREVRGTVFINDSVYMNVNVYLCDKCFADCKQPEQPAYPPEHANLVKCAYAGCTKKAKEEYAIARCIKSSPSLKDMMVAIHFCEDHYLMFLVK